MDESGKQYAKDRSQEHKATFYVTPSIGDRILKLLQTERLLVVPIVGEMGMG